VGHRFGDLDAGGRGLQTFDLRTTVHCQAALECALLDLLGQHLGVPMCALLGEGQQRTSVQVLGYLFYIGDRRKTSLRTATIPALPMIGCAFGTRKLSIAHPWCAWRRRSRALRIQGLQVEGRRARGEQELLVVTELAGQFPEARITLDPNGAWSLEEAVRLGKAARGILAYAEDPCGAQDGYSGREIMAEFRRATGLPTATNMIATDWRQLVHAVQLAAIDIPSPTRTSGPCAARCAWHRCVPIGAFAGLAFQQSLRYLAGDVHAGGGRSPRNITAIDTHWIWQDGERLTREPLQIVNGAIEVPQRPGLGVELDMQRIEDAHRVYQTLGGAAAMMPSPCSS